MNIPINSKAPVKSYDEVEITASTDKVWQILTTINNWSNWQSEVTKSNLIGELEEGAEFNWKAGGISFQSKIHTMKPKKMFGWTGKTIGANAIHNWFFEEKNGKTIVRVEESLQGVLIRIFKNYFQKNLNKGMQKNLIELKKASE